MRRLLIFVLATAGLIGCATPVTNNSAVASCKVLAQATPAIATANHGSPSPANQVQFVADAGNECTGLVGLIYPSWSNPDPLYIQIDSSATSTNGTAICKGPTSGAVTLTGTAMYNNTPVTTSVSLTCQ